MCWVSKHSQKCGTAIQFCSSKSTFQNFSSFLLKYTLCVKTFSVAKLAGKILMSVCSAVSKTHQLCIYWLSYVLTCLVVQLLSLFGLFVTNYKKHLSEGVNTSYHTSGWCWNEIFLEKCSKSKHKRMKSKILQPNENPIY